MPLPSLLLPGCEKPPASPNLNYVPPDGELHPVTAVDSWWTLAALPKVQEARPGMTALDLCKYNFQTTSAPEINWYLRNKAGCTAATGDKKNYRFSGGEKIYLPTKNATAGKPKNPVAPTKPSVNEVVDWFRSEVVPLRTTNAGGSPNRIYKTPLARLRGNRPDPNGLCGDAQLFVSAKMRETYGGWITSNNYALGDIVWVLGDPDSPIFNLNHAANVLVPFRHLQLQDFVWSETHHMPVPKENTSALAGRDILGLWVLDLYYKRATPLRDWWRSLSSSYAGMVRIMS